MRRRSSLLTLSTLAVAVGLTSCRSGVLSKAKSSSAPAATPTPAPATPQKITVTGTVALDTDVKVSDADGLTTGGPVPNATVFFAGAPSQAVKADAKGAFTIDLDLPSSGSSLTDAGTYELVVWYTTTTAQHRFGVLKSTPAEPGATVDLGEVALSYTRKATFTLTDRSGAPIAGYGDGQTCAVTFPGFEGKITVAAADGVLTGTYIPPGTYDVKATCAGYQPTTQSVVVTPVGNFTDVQAVTVMLAPQ